MKRSRFTLIELLIILSILGVLLGALTQVLIGSRAAQEEASIGERLLPKGGDVRRQGHLPALAHIDSGRTLSLKCASFRFQKTQSASCLRKVTLGSPMKPS